MLLNKFEYYYSKILKKLQGRAIINSFISKKAKIASGSHIVNSKIFKYTDIGYNCQIIETEIGKYCSIGMNVIIGGAEHTIDWVSTSQVFNNHKDSIKKKFSTHEYNPYKKTIIGNDVWIANNVLIKSGIKIGDGAIIGMGAVVTKDVPSYEIWGGNPAKLIKKRFSIKIIEKLEKIKWWELDEEKLKELSKTFNNIEEFITKIEIQGENNNG